MATTFGSLLVLGLAASPAYAHKGPPINIGSGPLGTSITYKLSGASPGSSTPETPHATTSAIGPLAAVPTRQGPSGSSPNVLPAVGSPATMGPVGTGSTAPARAATVATGSTPATTGYLNPCIAVNPNGTKTALQPLSGYRGNFCGVPITALPATAHQGTAQPAQPPPPPPSAVAASYWAQQGANQLPSPHPYIAPGYALAGLPGYLEVRAPLTATFTDSTRLGTLTIQATATVWVNWGDGDSNDGPYHTSGGPWPNGTIHHYWDNDGTYAIVVSEDWSATWSLAGQSGTLGGLQTQGSIPKFEVGQVESVRNYWAPR